MKKIELIKKSLKSKTLIYDIFSYFLITIGYADKYLAGQLSMYKTYKWLDKRYRKHICKNYDLEKSSEYKNYVWICWFQGLENAPEVVKNCISSIKYWLKDWKIVILTEENIKDYVNIPSYIIEKRKKGIITDAHYSDILRLELLIKYGGLWLDATTYITGELPEYVTKSDFFVYRNGWFDMEMINMGSWFIYSKSSNNEMLLATRDLIYKYWKKTNYIKNYFLMHMFFRMVSDIYYDKWSNVPVVNHIDSHLLMNELNKKYEYSRCEDIKKITSIHKLTHKNVKNEKNNTSFYLDEIYRKKELNA